MIGSCLLFSSKPPSASSGATVIEVSFEPSTSQRFGTSSPNTSALAVEASDLDAPELLPVELPSKEFIVPKRKVVKPQKTIKRVPDSQLTKSDSTDEPVKKDSQPGPISQEGSPLSLNPNGSVEGGGPRGDGGNSQAKDSYLALIGAALAKHKRYPIMARKQGVEGNIKLDLQINRDGTLRDVSLKISSGSDLLDRAAIQMAQESSPFAALPPTLPGDFLHVTVPVVYKLR